MNAEPTPNGSSPRVAIDTVPAIETVPLKSLKQGDRPRERLRFAGAEALSDRELLALVLGSGTRQRSVIQLAEDLLRGGGRLEALADLGLGELARFEGLGEAGACRVAALVEIGRRMARARARGGAELPDAKAVFELLRGDLIGERRERVVVLLLDARHRLIAQRCVSLGSLMSSVIHPREVFRPAIGLAAAALILVHNHPSGDPTPSVEDHQVTLRIAEAGALLGIRLLDHVVVAADGWKSFKEEGWLPERW
jgi:DNA repair protein RadC